MAETKGKVFVAMSGGVDSSTATALLLKDGYDCSGVFMITCDNSDTAQKNAEEMARRLGIRLCILDLRSEFEQVLDYFIGEYKKGRTPNPCVFCNRSIKFGKMWNFAKENGADFFATGHYAQILEGETGPGLYRGVDSAKDQSYALAMIDRNLLGKTIFPLGRFCKKNIMELASSFGLEIKGRKESQEICFIPNDDYAAIIEQRCPEIIRKGNIIDSSGKILGQHSGTHRFTIGQRRGLRVPMGVPFYVVDIDAQKNTVTLGPKNEVFGKTLIARDVNWLIDKPAKAFEAGVKIRYNSKVVPATVHPEGENARIEFDEPVAAITPGQLAVFYVRDNLGEKVAGGGWIDKQLKT